MDGVDVKIDFDKEYEDRPEKLHKDYKNSLKD